MSHIDTLQQALKDPELEGVDCLVPENRDLVAKALEEFPDATHISEWRYEMGRITYKYHVHGVELGEELKRLAAEGKTSRHPKLVDVYEVSQLDTILAPVPAGSH